MFTKKQKKEVRGYVEKWRTRLYLHQWNFGIYYEKEKTDDSGAEIKMQTEYKFANIFIKSQFFTNDEKIREEIIVHELCHCLIQPLIELMCKASDGHALSQREIDWHKESVTQHLTCSLFYK